MTLTMMLLLAAAIVLPLVWISRRHSAGKTVKKPLIAHCLSFFVLVAAATVVGFVCSGSALAVDTAAEHQANYAKEPWAGFHPARIPWSRARMQ